jgi:hypothetical protein
MEYKQFVVKAFEREPGKWRASVERANGKALIRGTGRQRRTLDKFITGMDATAAEAAMQMAMAAIDANAFSRISDRDKRQARAGLKDDKAQAEQSAGPSPPCHADFVKPASERLKDLPLPRSPQRSALRTDA